MKFRKLISVLLPLAMPNCGSSFIPTIEHPTPSQWCFDWVIYGYPAKACFGTEAQMRAAKAKALAPQAMAPQQDAGQ
jgi:hypothetical protein